MFGEVIAGPVKLYRAEVGTAEPLPPTDTPDLNIWTLIGGTQATDDVQIYSKDGLNIAMTDEREEVEVMNELYPIDEFITSARQKFEIKLKDMTIQTLGMLIGNTVVDEAPTASDKGYYRTSTQKVFRPPKHAILVVGFTPYDDLEDDAEGGMNYWAPRVTFKGPGAFDRKLSTPADVTLMINSLVHPTLGIGYATANYAPTL